MTIILILSYVAYSVLNIRPLNLVLMKKKQQLHSRSQYWNDNEAAPANGGFVNKTNMTSKYAMTSNLRYDEKCVMMSLVRETERVYTIEL